MNVHLFTTAAPAAPSMAEARSAGHRSHGQRADDHHLHHPTHGHIMNAVYDVCIDRGDGTSEPRLIEADNSTHALAQALLDPTVLSAVVL